MAVSRMPTASNTFTNNSVISSNSNNSSFSGGVNSKRLTSNGSGAVYNVEDAEGGNAGFLGIPRAYRKWDRKQNATNRMSADQLREHNFSDFGFDAMHAAMANGYSYGEYKRQIIDEIMPSGDPEKMLAYLKWLIGIINRRTPNGASIRDLHEPDPYNEEDAKNEEELNTIDADTGKTLRDVQNDPNWMSNSVTNDDVRNGFYVSIAPNEVDSDEAKAIRLITKGGSNALTAIMNKGYLRQASNKNYEKLRETYKQLGVDSHSVQSMIANGAALFQKGSNIEAYQAIGDAWAQAEFLMDMGDKNGQYYINAVNKQLESMLAAGQKDAEANARFFMYKKYVDIVSNLDPTIIRNNPEIAKKKSEADAYNKSPQRYWQGVALAAYRQSESASDDIYDRLVAKNKGGNK